MSPNQKKRMVTVVAVLFGIAIATLLALQAMRSSIEFFLTPTEVEAGELAPAQIYKIAGIVKKNSLTRLEDGVTQQFVVTDCEHDVRIQYTGILPDLFREGQAIISTGMFDAQNMLIAKQVLAKHDENYVPKEAAQAMMQAQANKCDTTEGPIEI
ncbi:MAG: cytochrome c maturation protein CcmE [Pseudomonadota bacterium]